MEKPSDLDAIRYCADQIYGLLEGLLSEKNPFKKQEIEHLQAVARIRYLDIKSGRKPTEESYGNIPPFPSAITLNKEKYTCVISRTTKFPKTSYRLIFIQFGPLKSKRFDTFLEFPRLNSVKDAKTKYSKFTLSRLPKVRNILKGYANAIVLSKNSSEEDIFIEFMILAVKNGVIYDVKSAREAFSYYLIKKSMIRGKRMTLNQKQDIAEEIFTYVVTHYARPFEPGSFKTYLRRIVTELQRSKKREELYDAPEEKTLFEKTTKKDPSDSPGLFFDSKDDMTLENYDIEVRQQADTAHPLREIYDEKLSRKNSEYMKFMSSDGTEWWGVDQIAKYIGIHRTTVYRYLKQNHIEPRSVEESDNNSTKYYLLTKEQTDKLRLLKQARKLIIRQIAKQKNIKIDSARKTVLRLEKKGFELRDIRKKYSEI
jgi:DNA-directed RNA polymerase specialized sigma24 family protein